MSKLPIPREILAQHTAILGKTRSGKSSVMRLLVEDLLERKQPVCIVDPKGDWWGIKLAADGKSAGYPVVIFGGEHGDIPIGEESGARVAELFATGNRPCLIDLGGWMVAPRTRFWIDFASTLFKLTKGERVLAVDEIHNFCPKGSLKGTDGNMAKALHWTNRLASEGLGKGVAMIFASQRPQKVHNDTLTSAETLIAMRVLHPSDRNAVADWIKGCGDSEGSEVLGSLAQMDRGEGWAWSPEIGFGPKRVKFPLFKTYDSFRAQTVEDTKRLTGWADVNIEDVKAKFAAAIEKAKAEDPKELRRLVAERDKTIRELQAVNVRHANAVPAAKEKRVEVPVLKEGHLGRFEKALTGLPDRIAAALSPLTTLHDRVHGAVEPVLASVREVAGLLGKLNGHGQNGGFVHRPGSVNLAVDKPLHREQKPRPVPVSAPKRGTSAAVDTEIGGGVGRRMLSALAQFGMLRQKRLAMLTGCVLGGSTWRGGMAKLRSAGFVAEDGDVLQITDSGAAALGEYETLPSDMVNYWRGKLRGGAPLRAFDVILAAYPGAVDPQELADACEFENGGSTMRGALAKLRGFELIGRELRASEELFG